MSIAILFHVLCAQHVSDINISIIRSLQLCCWITTSVVLFSVLVLQAEACKTSTTQNQPHQISNTQRTENKTTDVVIQQRSRKLLMMDILMPETCWAHKKWNKIASDMKLVFHSSTITMMHGPINIRLLVSILCGVYPSYYLFCVMHLVPVPASSRSKAWVWGRSPAEIVGSNPTGGMDVRLLSALCFVT